MHCRTAHNNSLEQQNHDVLLPYFYFRITAFPFGLFQHSCSQFFSGWYGANESHDFNSWTLELMVHATIHNFTYFTYLFIYLFVYFRDRVSLCTLGRPGTHYVDSAD